VSADARGTAPAEASRQSRDAAALILGRVLATLSDALLPLVLVRLLAKDEVGLLGGVLLVYQTVALVVASGLPTTLMYYMPGRTLGERRAIALLMARGLFGFGVVASALLLAVGALHALWPGAGAGMLSSMSSATLHGVAGSLALLAAFPLGDLPARMLPNLLVIEGKADSAARFAVARSLGTVLFVLVPAGLGLGIQAVILSYGVFGLLQGAWLWRVLRGLYAGAPKESAPVTFGGALRFAWPLGATDIVGQLNQRFDRYLIAAHFSVAMFAEYHVGAFQIPILTTIAYSVGTAYTPTLTEHLRDGRAREAIAIWRGTITKTSLLVVPLSAVFVIAAEPLVELLFTAKYSNAVPVFRYYALSTAGRVAAFGVVMVAAGKPHFVLRAALCTLICNALLGSLGLWLFGFEGPALGACVAFVPTVAAYCYYIAQATGLRTREIFPVVAYVKVVALAALAALPAMALQHVVSVPPLAEILGVAAVTLSAFTVLGRLTGIVQASDLEFLKQRLGWREGRP
jgi:O-antigen/teichoic acid export membrane protein